MADSHEFLCARCARHMKTCCQTSEVYATLGDVERIAAHTGQRDFVEFRVPEDPIYLEQSDDPTWEHYVFRDDGTRRVVRRLENGDCVFLGEQGCVLPLEVRPLICRIYPYDFNAEGIKAVLARGCPTELIRSGETLLTELDIQITDAERWRKQLYDELPAEKP